MPEHFNTLDDALGDIQKKFEAIFDRPRYYRLLSNGAVEPCGMWEWAESLERDEQVLFQNYVGQFFISTIFLGLDHGWGGAPVLFETMVSDHRNLRPEQKTIKQRRVKSVWQWRCTTYQEIWSMHWEGHAAAIEEQTKWLLA